MVFSAYGGVVGSRGIEPLTSSVSTKRSTTELTALKELLKDARFFAFPMGPLAKKLEAQAGIEPAYNCFADSCLTAWLLRRDESKLSHADTAFSRWYNTAMFRKIALSVVLADNYVTNLAGSIFRKQWRLDGKCKKCGRCCREIHLKIEPRLLGNQFTKELVVRWISWLFCFYLIKIDYERNYLVFGCRNLKPDGTCNDYRWRANVCRNYPLVDYFEKPVLFEGCGYKAALRSD